jgi:hypothetical protein
VQELRDSVDRAGLGKDLKVSSEPATAADIAGLASKLGHTAQLDKIEQMLKGITTPGGGSNGGGK